MSTTAPVRDLHALEELAREAAELGGRMALETFRGRSAPAEVAEKRAYHDVVTETDRRVEQAITELLLDRAPGSRVLGEEGGWTGDGDLTWYIDPIDGTSNFASGLPIFATSVAALHGEMPVAAAVHEAVTGTTFHLSDGRLLVDGEPYRWPTGALRTQDVEIVTNAPYEGSGLPDGILDPVRAVLGSFRAVRRLGACTLHLVYVAAGRAAASYEYEFYAWDVAAALPLAEAAGCTVLAWDEAGRVLADPTGRPERVRRVLVTAPGLDAGGIDWEAFHA